MRLRNESGQLRIARQELDALRAKLAAAQREAETALATSIVTTHPPPPGSEPLPKESWAFAGYGSPEAALESFAWSMAKGDVNTWLQSMAPEVRQQVAKQFEGKTQEEISAVAQQRDQRPRRPFGSIGKRSRTTARSVLS